jgi:hypothetical protein
VIETGWMASRSAVSFPSLTLTLARRSSGTSPVQGKMVEQEAKSAG